MIDLEELQPYNFERYLVVNPYLTIRMYEYLRENNDEWKILCGIRVKIKWENEILEEVWYLKGDENYKETDFYKFRFEPEKYLALNNW